jgi:enoyl-CoA hydratase/carnithine racemase
MPLRIDDRAGVRLVTLSRPEALNAFNNELYDAGAAALTDAAVDDAVAVVVVTGEGRAFSAGQDLGEMLALSDQRNESGSGHGFVPFMDALIAFPKPLVAAVNGVGVGLGLTLLGHCDLVLIAETARLRAPFTSLGVVPEAGSSVTLPELMGRQAAAHAIFTSAWIDASLAVDCGLAWKAVPADDLLDEAMAVAAEIAAMPLVSLVESKRLLNAGRLDLIRAARAREDEVFARLTGGPANRAAIEAFLHKRQ